MLALSSIRPSDRIACIEKVQKRVTGSLLLVKVDTIILLVRVRQLYPRGTNCRKTLQEAVALNMRWSPLFMRPSQQSQPKDSTQSIS